MTREELIKAIETLCKAVAFSDKSSEEKKITVLENIKPSSFGLIMEEIIYYIEMY